MKKSYVILALFALAAMFGLYTLAHADIFGTNLIGWWTFDSNRISPTIADSSGSGYNGYIFGTATSSVAGVLGQGLFTNTSNVYVSPVNFSVLTDATISFWVQPIVTISSGGNEEDLFWINDQAPSNSEYTVLDWNAFSISDGKLTTDVKLGGGDNNLESTRASWTGGQWYFIAVEMGASGRKIYVNGTLDNSSANASAISSQGGITAASVTLCGGGFGGSHGTGTNANCDDFRVFKTALPQSAIQAMYYQGIGQHSN